MSDEIVFSIQTCTYNRRSTLVRTYQSLVAQTFRGFEWIVYDNGSDDGTSDLVRSWQKDADFPIVLMGRPDNAAIQLSWNIVINVARGKFWTLLDSDDACVPTALEEFKRAWDDIPDQQKHKYVGVSANCNDQHGHLVGQAFPCSPMDSNALDLVYREKISGEKWGVMRVDVLKKFPFPDSNHHALPGVVWRAIAREYQTRYINESLRIYYIEENSRSDQMSFHQKTSVVAVGKRENSMDLLNNYYSWLLSSPIEIVRNAFVYTQMSSALKVGLGTQIKNVTKPLVKILVIAAWPIGKLWGFVPQTVEKKLRMRLS